MKNFTCTIITIISFFLQVLHAQTVKHNSTGAAPFNRFEELAPNTIHPHGWLREFLLRQQTGMTGHHEALDYPFNTVLWNGVLPRSGDHGDEFWRYEQTGYLVDAIIRLGYLLNDKALIKEGEDNVKYTLSHLQANGRMGPENASQWPNAVFFRVLKAYYQSTKNPLVLEVLEKHYLSITAAELGIARNIVNLEGMLWLYGLTRKDKLLDLAEKSYEVYNELASNKKEELTLSKCLSPDTIIMHGVSYMEQAKIPAILYSYTGKKIYFDAAVNAFEKLEKHHMLPDAVPSSNEFLAGKDIMRSHETCDITDYSWALGYLLMANGNAILADRIEKAVFNAGPGAVTKDFRALQYMSGPNQVIATFQSDHNKASYGENWMAYSPIHMTECCSGNVNRFMPNFATRMWMQDDQGGLVSVFFGPSSIDFSLANSNDIVTVQQETNYPFDDLISYKFSANKKCSLPFSFRIPAWCSKPELTINGKRYKSLLQPGSFVKITVGIDGSSSLVLKLPMKPVLIKVNDNGLAINYGPLLYAFPVPTKAEKDTAFHPLLHGKKATNPAFPAWNFYPAAEWNYALAVSPDDFEKSIKLIRKKNMGYPFEAVNTTVLIRVPVRKIKSWELLNNQVTPALPVKGKYTVDTATSYIDLVPYGSTCLRISVFPSAIAQVE